MIKFKSLILQNFMCFGNRPTTINLDTDKTTLIIGQNKDIGEDGDSRNGSGKSAIFNSLFWCLFDEAISEVRQDEMISFQNERAMEVSVSLEIDNIPYLITRGRKPNRIEVLRDGEPFTLSTTNDINESIRILLKTTPEIFLNTYLLDANKAAFMALKPAAQRDFMEHFLGLEKLSVRASALKKIRDDNSFAIAIEEGNLKNARDNRARAETQILNLTVKADGWKVDKQNRQLDAEREIHQLSAIDVEAELKRHEQKELMDAELYHVQVSIDKLDAKHNILDAELGTLRNNEKILDRAIAESQQWEDKHAEEVRALNTEFEKLSKIPFEEILLAHSEMREVQLKVSGLGKRENDIKAKLDRVAYDAVSAAKEQTALKDGKCPFCKQAFHDNNALKEAQLKLTIATTKVSEMEVEAEEFVLDEEKIRLAFETLQTNLKGMISKEECLKSQTRLAVVNDKLNTVENETNPFATQINEGRIVLLKSRPLQKITDEIAAVVREIENKEAEMDAHVYGLKAFECMTSKQELLDVKTQLALAQQKLVAAQASEPNPYEEQIAVQAKFVVDIDETALKTLQMKGEHLQLLIKLLSDSKSFVRKNIIDNYVPFLNTTINKYLIDSAHAVKINGDLTVELYYIDYSASYGSMSKGEKLRLNYATTTAFRKMAETFGNTFNCLFVDEYFDAGSDPAFFKKVFDDLSREDKSIFIISHRDELKTLADREMTVVKQNGFSSIEKWYAE